jgi:hypothetical protein
LIVAPLVKPGIAMENDYISQTTDDVNEIIPKPHTQMNRLFDSRISSPLAGPLLAYERSPSFVIRSRLFDWLMKHFHPMPPGPLASCVQQPKALKPDEHPPAADPGSH